MSPVKNQRRMLVPGIEITNVQEVIPENLVLPSKTAATYRDIGIDLPISDFFPERKNNKLFQPVVESHRGKISSENPKECISISALTFLNREKKLLTQYDETKEEPVIEGKINHKFKYFYKYHLSEDGHYQLILYITFCEPRTSRAIVDRVRGYFHKIIFLAGSIKDGANNDVPLGYIDTVKVYLVNENPKTSRGTVTTVQSGDD
ncbi:MAG: hypothetical protein JXR05_16875 [Flavobacteriaceae bacterium]